MLYHCNLILYIHFYTFTTVETYLFVPKSLWNSDNQNYQTSK